MMPAKRTLSSPQRVPFEEMDSFSTLFEHYSRYDEHLAPFYAGDYRNLDTFHDLAQKTTGVRRNRSLIADILTEQNIRWGLDAATERNIDKLRQANSVAVVTGQQLGIFLSPLFISYKTLTTLLLAERLQKNLDRPVVPIFWLHGEDHDFAETAPLHLLDDSDNLVQLHYEPGSDPAAAPNGPVGRMTFTPAIERLLESIASCLPATPNKEELLAFLNTHFTEGAPLIDGFAALLKRLFKGSGLVLMSVDDRRLKQECSPLFQQEIEAPYELTEAIVKTTEELKTRYHAQVQVQPTNIFLMTDHARIAIEAEDSVFRTRKEAASITREELSLALKETPERFSPNVVLRPLVQDFLLPTIAYIGGPGEVAYFAQLKPAYEWANLPMPVIYPRASVTLIEPAVQKWIDEYPMPLQAYRDDPNKIFRSFVIDRMPIDIDGVMGPSREHIDQVITSLDHAAREIDETLVRSAASTRVRIHQELTRFEERLIRAQKRMQNTDLLRINKVCNHLFPRQKLQERVLSPLHFLNAYGLDFFTSLLPHVSHDTTDHQVIRL